MSKKCLVFGSTGSIGNFILKKFIEDGIHVIGTTSNINNISENIIYVTNENLMNLKNIVNISIVIWAQGSNYNDNILTYDNALFTSMVDGNITFILNTLNYLMKHNLVVNNAKMVIISSIWQDLTRENKLSYSITKSALNGLIKNVAYDLASKQILINNILPGVVDNNMTRNTLQSEQLEYIKSSTKFDRLITLDDIFTTIKFLVIENTGITGQSIKIDLGFTNVKNYH